MSVQPPAQDTLREVETLTFHSLGEIRCDHETSRDKALCNCGRWASDWLPSVQAAKEAWATHALAALREQTSTPDAETALRKYVQHTPTCLLSISRSILRKPDWCTCGLTDLLRASSVDAEQAVGE